ncbi:protein Lines homolog 1 [Mugil cephalus]|uniref:protein Lines homolog 1 n=1 Tax=Mugil cephalus TaxID=48193 RepID=UPI001FB84E78|nr:protein Lines homolog 1 [Mugil cephalus]
MTCPYGRSGAMEHGGVCRDPSNMGDFFNSLTDAYRCFVNGTCPKQSAADLASVIFSAVSVQVSAELREYDTASEYSSVNSCEVTCMSVTLVEKMSSGITSQSLSPQVTLYCAEVLKVLFGDMDLMSHLVFQFQVEDQFISHLAAKTVAALVFYHFHKYGLVSPVWQEKCVQAFHSSRPGAELDACLWSVTEVIKKLLRGAHQEILGKLVTAFDCSLSALFSRLLPEERKYVPDFTSNKHWGTTFCLLLDLLEVLTASRLMCGAGACLKSQRITHTHSSRLLTVISCSSEYFVKKRALLLLKRALLQKVGEDWALGELLATGLKCENLSSDMSVLVQSVLTAVADNWLQSVQVERAAFFGGTRHTEGAEDQKPDSVILRAVSLIVLKSIELHFETAGGTVVEGDTDVSGYLQSLWCFLRRCSIQLMELRHLCCWISFLFGEQDDDMMEAARSLLSIFLKHRLCSGLDDVAMLEAACESGCNPHCHFVILLQSISFDHSILLDFLISTETCFLEYFVRYLKYLRGDWQGFAASCVSISVSDSLQQSLTASCGGDEKPALTYKAEPNKAGFSSCVQPTAVNPPAEPRLVEYDTSDESESENMEILEVKPGSSVCEGSRFGASTGLPACIGQKQYESSPALKSGHNSTLEKPECRSQLALQSKPMSHTNMADRAVLCLSELREVVTRLQTKKLFPYNPSSLLKLLSQVENCYQQSHLPHRNN